MSRTKLKTFIPLFTTLFRSILKRFYSHNIYLYVYIIRYDERVIAAYVINHSFSPGGSMKKEKEKKKDFRFSFEIPLSVERSVAQRQRGCCSEDSTVTCSA